MARLPKLLQVVLAIGLSGPLASRAVAGEPLAFGQLQVQGTRLTLYQDGNSNDAEQTINVGEAAAVRTCYGGTDAACGAVEPGDPRVAGLLVLAELRGPELPDPVAYQTVPGGSFALPGFQQEGDYWLVNIRLVRADTRELVGLAEPAVAVLHVRQILLASATVTRLTLADLEARGITLSQQSFQAYNFAVGFAIQGSIVTIDMPVVFEGAGVVGLLSPPAVSLEGVPEDLRPVIGRWQPPQIVPFSLERTGEGGLEREDEEPGGPPEYPLFGAIVIPGTISFLNQFFDTKLIVANGAPADSGAVLSNVTGTLRLPPGNVLRLAQTDPPVMAGQAVPVVGADGVRSLQAGRQGTAAWTVEGLTAGTHALRIDIAADLERPGRSILSLAGSTQAAVEVVDARFHLTFSHPDVVREDEDYSLFVTVTNMSRADQNLIAVAIEDERITGAHKATELADPENCTLSPFRCTIPTLRPGQSETLEFRLVADITGEVVATTYQSTSVNAQGSIQLRTGVGLLGIPLSPASLILPRFSDRLKPPYLPVDGFYRANMRFLGLAYSLAVAPAGSAPNGLPHVIKSDVQRQAIDLAEAGQRTWLGDETLRSLEVLALDLLGNRHPLEEMDALRRAIGQKLGPASQASSLGEVIRTLQQEQNLDAMALFSHLVETASYCPPFVAAALAPSGTAPRPDLEIRRSVPAGQQVLAFPSDQASAVRSLPYGEILAIQGYPGGPASAELALVGHVSTQAQGEPYQLVLRNLTDQPQAGSLELIVPDGESGAFRRVSYGAIDVPPHTVFVVVVGATVPSSGGFSILLPDGSAPTGVPSPVISPIALAPFKLIGSRQDFSGTSTQERYSYGMAVTYLFNRPPAKTLATNPAAFGIRSSFSGLDVNSVPVSKVNTKVGRAAFFQDDERVVILRYSSPVSALLEGGDPLVVHEHMLDTNAIRDRWDNALDDAGSPVNIEESPLHTGALVDGRVVHGTGQPAGGATVQLLRVRRTKGGGNVMDVVAEQMTGADGGFYFDFVEEPTRHGMIEPGFFLRAIVPAGTDPILESAQVSEVSSMVRLYNRLAHVNIALLGRGHLTGHLRYLGGGPVAGGTVTAVSTLFREMKSVAVAEDGSFTIGGMPVGPITLTGSDQDQFRVFATVGIEHPGDTVNVELEIQREEEKPPTFGEVAGVVRLLLADGSTAPVGGADVAVYAQGGVVGTSTTGTDGSFWVPKVPTGQVAVQAASWQVSRSPALTDVNLSEGQVARVTLTLAQSPIRSVTGRVLLADPVGGGLTPVQGAAVFIEGPGTYSYSLPDGTYRLDGVPGQGSGAPAYQLKAIDTQRKLQGEVPLPLILPDSPEVIQAPDIILEEMTGGVDGVVLDPLGRPYGGVKVVIFPYAEKSAGADGHFSFDRVGIGQQTVVAHVGNGLMPGKIGYFGEATTSVVFAGHRPFVTVRLRGGGVVSLVTKTATSPGILSMVAYNLTWYNVGRYEIGGMPEWKEVSTDQNGRLELAVPVGRYSIRAYNPFHGMREIVGDVEYPGQLKTHEIVFQELSTVRGVVVDVDGATPVPGAEVSMATSTLLPQKQYTDALGRFQYELVPPGNVVLTAKATIGTVERVGLQVTGSQQPGQTFDVTVRLKAQGTVTGQVVRRDGGQLVPVANAHFYVSEHEFPFRVLPGRSEWLFTDEDGRFSVSHVFAGRVTVTARHPELHNEQGSGEGVLTTDWEVVDVGQVEIKHEVGSIIVTVRDPATGAVVPDCQVSLGVDKAVTDADGRARFDALSLWPHDIYAFHAPTGRSGLVRGATLSTPGQVLEATLYLEARGEVQGHVFDDIGKSQPVPGASVSLTGSGVGGSLTALATTSGVPETLGHFEFGGIPAGHFDLLAWTSTSQRRARGSVELTATAPLGVVDLVFERIGDLSIRVFEKLQAGLVELNPASHVLSVSVVQGCVGPDCAYSFTQVEPGVPAPNHLFQFADLLTDRAVDVSVEEYDGEQRRGHVYLASIADGQGTASNPITVVLDPRGVVRVAVRDATGSLIPGAPVVVTLANSRWSTTVVTGSDGIATALGVPAGQLSVSASLAGQSGTVSGLLEFDDQVLEVSVQLSAAASAHGIVYQPVSGDHVGAGTSLVPQPRALATLHDAQGQSHVAIAGDDGVYRFSGLPLGTYSLEICDYTCEALARVAGALSGPHGTDQELPSVVLDAVPPQVLAINPAPGLEGVSRVAAVEIVFSELLEPSILPGGSASGLFSVTSVSGTTPAGLWTAVEDAEGRQVVRFEPSAPYENLTWYGVTIAGGQQGVRDRAGRLLKQFGNVGSSFKTSDTIGPAVIGTEPSLLRPVPPLGTIRVDFNEAVVIGDEGLDGDGTDDAAELFWERNDGAGGVAWQVYPVVLYLTRGGFSLAMQPHTGLDLTGDTGRRRLRVDHIDDFRGNPMPVWEQIFRIYDSHSPIVDVSFPAGAPTGVLSAGTSYSLIPVLSELDDLSPQNPGGDVDRVEYFLSEPMVGAVPAYTAVTYPFAFTFVAAYGGSGTDPSPLSIWVRVTDTSTNQSNLARLDMQTLPNQAPTIGSVVAAAMAPVSGAPYPGSTIRVTVAGSADPDGALLTVVVALVPASGGNPVAILPAQSVARPPSGSWADMSPLEYDLVIPLTAAEGTALIARATVTDSRGASGSADSISFLVVDDQAPPTIEGPVARKPGHPATSLYYIGETIVLELRARDTETAVSSVSLSFSEHFAPQVATLIAGSTNLYRTPELVVPEISGEVAITATAEAADFGGNVASGATTFTISPTADPYAPVAEWLTPWEGAAWPASYTSVIPTQAGSWLLLRLRATDLDLGGGEVVPGSISSVKVRGPVNNAGTIELATDWTGATRLLVDGVPSDIWELPWLIPDGVTAGTWLPFEARVSDLGANVVTRSVRMQAAPFRKVYEGAHTAVLPSDSMLGPGGAVAGGVFLLDGAVVSLYPQEGPTLRLLPALHLYAGGEVTGETVGAHPSKLTVPEITSPTSPILYYPLELQISETVGVGHGASLDVSSRGLLGSTPSQSVVLPGTTPAQPGAGGSHGGRGWFGSPGGWERDDLLAPGSVYDSVREPHLPGSGGGWQDAGSVPGGTGGGVIRLLAAGATVHLAGELIADGGEGPLTAGGAGGGAGGTVFLDAGRLEGSGRVSANGGRGHSNNLTGGGGGGRISVRYRELGAGLALSANTSVAGGQNDQGHSWGGAGTVFWQRLDSVTGQPLGSGNLLVANGSAYPAALTPLPALGTGEVVDVDPVARTITLPVPQMEGEIVGESVVVGIVGEPDRVWEITGQETVLHEGNPATRLAVLADEASVQSVAGALAGGQTVTFLGRSHFASVSARGAARLVTDDDLEIGDETPTLNDRASITLADGARVLLRSEGPSISLTPNPAAGSAVLVGSSIAAPWTAGSQIGLRKVTQEWALAGGPQVTYFPTQPASGGDSGCRLSIPPSAPPGQATSTHTVTDWAGRSSSISSSWQVQSNSPPTGSLAFAPGAPAVAFQGATVGVEVSAQDAEGLLQIALSVNGLAVPSPAIALVTGTSATRAFAVTVAPTAVPGSPIEIMANVTDSSGAVTVVGPLALDVQADTTPPAITTITPSPGQVVTEGQVLQLDFSLEDEASVASVTLTVDGQVIPATLTGSAQPGQPWTGRARASWRAPVVTSPTTVAFSLEARDPVGNSLPTQGTFVVQPESNPLAPVVTIKCPASGDGVRPGVGVSVVFHLQDTDKIELYTVAVDGTAVYTSPVLNVLSYDGTFWWMPPAGATPGSAFTIRVEARDFAANVRAAEVQLVVPSGRLLVGSQTLDMSYAEPLVLAAGTFTVPAGGILAPGIRVMADARLVTVPERALSVTVPTAGEVRVDCGGGIDASGQGFAGGSSSHPDGSAPDGVVPSKPSSGGSHGGQGRAVDGSGPAGETFDSVYWPALAGGGGSALGSSTGLRGGGLVTIEAGSLVIEGDIHADGESSGMYRGGGGAGGSVRIRATSVAGRGKIDAIGTSNGQWDGELTAGGGGRVAIVAEHLQGFDPTTQVTTSGPGTGTLFLSTSESVHGVLEVGSAGSAKPWTVLPKVGTGQLGTVVDDGQDAWVEPAVGATVDLGVVGMWVRVNGVDYRVKAQQDRQHVLLEGAAGQIQAGQQFEGVYKFDRLKILPGARLEVKDRIEVGEVVDVPAAASLRLHRPLVSPRLVVAGGGISMVGEGTAPSTELNGVCFLEGKVSAEDVTIKAGARVLPEDGGSIRLKAADVLRVEAGARLELWGKGYPGGKKEHLEGHAPPEVGMPSWGAAGSHGGQGSRRALVGSSVSYSGAAGEAYDSIVAPGLGGGGGSVAEDGYYTGGAGGGSAYLEASAVELDGDVLAQAFNETGDQEAPGAGGSVRIVAGVLRGAGVINAFGGSSQTPYASSRLGAGGGGRVALEVGSFDGFNPTTQVLFQGGAATGSSGQPIYGGAGTLWLKTSQDQLGELIVDQRLTMTSEVAWTHVPGVGEGVVGSVVVDGTDAWLAPEGGAKVDLGVVGAWVRVAGADYRVKAQTDRQHILLEGAAGALSTGQPYSGVCKFDKVTVRGRARLVIPDPLWEGMVTDIEAGSVLEFGNEDAPVVTTSLFQSSTSLGKYWISAGQGAVSDSHGIGSVVFRNRRTDQKISVTVGSGGSIPATQVPGTPGDEVEAVVTDAHPRPRSTTALVGVLAPNAGPPTITPFDVIVEGYQGGFRVRGNDGAIVDSDGILTASVQNPARSQAVAISTVFASGRFNPVTLPAAWQVGDLLRIEAKDGHPAQAVALVDIGAIPANLGPPAIDPTKVIIEIYQKRFRVRGDVGAILDPDGTMSASIINQARSQSLAISKVFDNGAFNWVVLPTDWQGGELLQVEAKDGHPNQASRTEDIRVLPVNLGPPIVDQGLLYTAAGPPGYVADSFRGHPGTVSDLEGPVSVHLRNLRTLAEATANVNPDGGFVIGLTSEPGDTIELTATDSHPQPQLTTVLFVRNKLPVVNPALIEVHYVGPDAGRGLGAGYDVTVHAEAISDEQPPFLVTLGRDNNWDGSFDAYFGTWSIAEGTDALLRLGGDNPAPGDRLLLQVEDSHPTERMWKRIVIGPLPTDNYAPIVDSSRIHLTWVGEVLHLVGDAEAVVDPDAPISLVFNIQERPDETYGLSIGDGQAFDIEVSANEGEHFTLNATDNHTPALTTTVTDLGPVPGRTNTAPSVALSRIHYSWVSQAELRLVGDPQAVADVDTPISLVATNQTTTTQYTGQADADGSFNMAIEGQPGQEFWLKATDSHPQSLFTEIPIGPVPERVNQKPVVTLAKLHLDWVDGVLHLTGDPEAVVDPDRPVNLLATNQQTGAAVGGEAAADGSFDLEATGEPGHVLRLRATDSHAQPEFEDVEAGTVPERPNAAPVIRQDRIGFAKVGGALHLVGQPQAVVDQDQPVILVAKNDVTQVEYPGQADADGSFSIPIQGDGGQEFTLRATDSHVPALSSEVVVGTVPWPNTEPDINPGLVHLEWVNGVLHMRGEQDAVVDPDAPIQLVARNEDSQSTFNGYVAAEGTFDLVVVGETGDLFTLTATDSHMEPLSRTEEIGEVPERPNTAPQVDRSKVHFVHESGQPVRIVCDADTVVDPDWPVHVEFIDETQVGVYIDIWIESSEAFEVAVDAASGDYFKLVATDSHPQWLATTEEHLGPVPTPNDSAPQIDTTRMHLIWDSEGRLHLAGDGGAVSDPDQPVTVAGIDRFTQRAFPGEAGTGGSFDLVLEAEPGHVIVVRATDGHVQPMSSEADVGFVPDRPEGSPRVRLERIRVLNNGAGSIEVIGEPGALDDPDQPLQVLVSNTTASGEVVGSAAEDGSFTLTLGAAAGDLLHLVVTDSQPLTTRVSLGPVPEPGKPMLRPGLVYLHALGAGFQVVGDSGAVMAGDGTHTVTVTAESAGAWTSAMLPDGSFRVSLPVMPHEQLSVIARDANNDASNELRFEAWVGFDGWYHRGMSVAGHTVTKLSEGRIAILDNGQAVTQLVGWGEVNQDRLLGGLSAAQDVVFNHRLYNPGSPEDMYRNLMALDQGSIAGWSQAGDPGARTKRTLQLSAAGTLKRANTRGDELLVAGEEPEGLRFFRLGLPVLDDSSLVLACGGGVITADLPGVRRILELVAGPDGVVGVVTDDPSAELWLVDVAVPGAVTSLGTVDLGGLSGPTWATWDSGNLILARAGGQVEIWRWVSSSGMQLYASWQPQEGVPTAANFVGDQLFVGLDSGKIIQVSLQDPASPLVIGDSALSGAVVAMSRDGLSQYVAPQGELVRDEVSELPPSVMPERVAWGHGTDAQSHGRSWVTVAGGEGEQGWLFDARLFWGNGELETHAGLFERRTINEDLSSPPSIVGVSYSRVPSSPYSPWTTGWRGFDNPRHLDYSLGLHFDPPTGCATNLATAGGSATENLRVIFTVTAASGQEDATYGYSVEGSTETGVATLPTNGAVVELFLYGSDIVVLDDGISGWATHPDQYGDQRAPTPIGGFAAIDLFGAAPVSKGVLTQERVIAVGGDPLSLAIVRLTPPTVVPGDLGITVLRTGQSAMDVLPDLAGAIVDLAVDGEHLWLLTNQGGTYRVYRYHFTENPAESPGLDQEVALAPGATPVALGLRYSDETHDEGYAVAIVRQGFGVDLRGEDLGFLSSTRVPGEAVDFTWDRWLLLGDHGIAELEGPNASPSVSFVKSNAWNPGKAVRGADRIVTPEGPTW